MAISTPVATCIALAAAAVSACGSAGRQPNPAVDSSSAGAAVVQSRSLSMKDQRVATGLRLRYAVQGDPGGPAVILLHGYSDSWFSFSPILPLLPDAYRVYALDQRGHGGSDQPPAGYHMADLAADVVAFMDARRIPRAVVVGHSMGSLVAQYVARGAPDRVAGLVLIGSGPSVHVMPGIDDFAALVQSFTDSVPLDFVREFQASTIHRPLSDSFVDRVVEESRRLQPHVWRGIMAGMLASEPVTRAIDRRIPTLLLWGDRDAVFLRAATDSLVAMRPQAELAVFPETGHAVHWERPERVAKTVTTFLAAVTAGS